MVTQFCMVSCYKLLKVMSNVIIQENKKLRRHNAIDNKFTPANFFIYSSEVQEIFRSNPIHLFRENLLYSTTGKFEFFVNKNVPKKMCNKKVLSDELCKK